MKSHKFLVSNLFIGAILGAILIGPIFVAWNLLADKLFFGSIDIVTLSCVVIPLCMVAVAVILRNRLPQGNGSKSRQYDKK
jgi:hypothetical protein